MKHLIFLIITVITCISLFNCGPKCVSGDCTNGKGTLTSGYFKYTGEFKNGILHGKGKAWFSRGTIYEGEFKNGMFDGYGVQIKDRKGHKDHNIKYEGFFKEGLYHGKGTLYRADGTVDKKGRWEKGTFIGP